MHAAGGGGGGCAEVEAADGGRREEREAERTYEEAVGRPLGGEVVPYWGSAHVLDAVPDL